MLRIAIVGVLALAAGCLRKTEYVCSGDSSCGAGGACETTGYCSFPDAKCTSGRSYGESAGSRAGTCTDGSGNPIPDADLSMPDGDETPMEDAADLDAPPAVCPSGYATITNGQAGHQYKVLTIVQNWGVQEAACQATTVKSHLAVPDVDTELQAMDTLIGANKLYWIGVSDQQTEMTWQTVLGGTQTYLPWLPPAPDDQSPGEDCVEAISNTHQFTDERCNTKLPAICECAP
jgi:hypothetical protein